MSEISIPSLKEFIPGLREKSSGNLTVKEIVTILDKVELEQEYKVTEGFKLETTKYLVLTGHQQKEVIVVFDTMFTTVQFLNNETPTKTIMEVGANVF